MADTIQGLENISDINILRTNLSSIALFIGIYEYMIDSIEERVESFLCDEMHSDEDGHLKYQPSKKYREKIIRRVVDEHGNKNTLKSSMLWLVEVQAIDENEYEVFLSLKKRRDSYVHKMLDHLWNGLSDEDANALVDLYKVYIKIDNWWINEIEIPIAGINTDDYDKSGVQSIALSAFIMMLQTLFFDKSDEYMKTINDLKDQMR